MNELEFVTAEALVSLVGCMGLVSIITQVCKWYIPKKVDPKWYTLVVSILVGLIRQLVIIQDFTFIGWILAIINIFVILASAIGIYETIIKPIQTKVEHKDEGTPEN